MASLSITSLCQADTGDLDDKILIVTVFYVDHFLSGRSGQGRSSLFAREIGRLWEPFTVILMVGSADRLYSSFPHVVLSLTMPSESDQTNNTDTEDYAGEGGPVGSSAPSLRSAITLSQTTGSTAPVVVRFQGRLATYTPPSTSGGSAGSTDGSPSLNGSHSTNGST